MLKLIHLADFHANKDRKKSCLEVLSQLKTLTEKILCDGDTPVVLFAGDFWDSTITNTETSGFTEYIKSVKQLCDITPVYMITGTRSHDPLGSYKVFESVGANVYSKNEVILTNDFNLLAIPEPVQVDYKGKNTSEISKHIIKDLKSSFEEFNVKLDKSKPSIVMYHGEVCGAKYQNGISAGESPDTYAVPTSWLKDYSYCALGHIHLPQRIEGTNAYYSGSVPAKDFGEEHKQGFNIVTFDEGYTYVERYLLDLPVNTTIKIDISNIESLYEMDFSGKNVKIELTLDKTLKKTFDSENLRATVKERTNANSVKIKFDYSKVSNIRSKEIAQSKTAEEKFKTYAELNGIKYKDSMLSKIKEIEDAMNLEQFIPCESFQLVSLSLRGAIGIKDGTGKDQIDINFEDYSGGILALTGKNGAGKTTIIENCHPFPRMLTRIGSLKDHFCLKDSHRILTYKTDDGKYVRISMIIDGAAKSIGTKYFVDIKNSESDEWDRLRSVDGSNESYNDWVSHTFGSVDLFLRTSFFAKEQVKGIPDLSKATKGEKMELFSILAGTDYLSLFAEQAKQKQKDIDKEITEIKKSVKDFDSVKENIDMHTTNIESWTEDLNKFESLVDIDNKELELYKIEQKKYEDVETILSSAHQNLKTKRDLKNNLQKQLDRLVLNINELNTLIENRETYKAQKDWYDENILRREALKNDLKKSRANISILEEHYREAQRVVSDLVVQKTEAEKDLSKFEIQLEGLEASIQSTDGSCPVCGAPLQSHKIEQIIADNNAKEKKIREIKKLITEKSSLIKKLDGNIKIYNLSELSDTLSKERNSIDEYQNDIDTITAYMETIDLEKIEIVLTKADESLKEAIFEKKDVSVQLEKIESEIKEIEDVCKNQPKDYSDKIKRLERGIQDSNSKIAELKASINMSKLQLNNMEKLKEQIEEVEQSTKSLQDDIKEYAIIERAFSNNGIQALELDSAAPELSDITNAILLESYGDRFTVSFDTQREGSDKRKIDDFIINVFDSECGRMKSLDLLCSGESVWIKQALYYAFSVLRVRRTGFCFRTRFLDESDGSLDSEARGKYIKMIEAAHNACGASLTVLITHSAEIKDVVSQKLELVSVRQSA